MTLKGINISVTTDAIPSKIPKIQYFGKNALRNTPASLSSNDLKTVGATTAEKKEVQFDVYDSATDKWSREDWECTYPNIDKLNATDVTVRVNNHR